MLARQFHPSLHHQVKECLTTCTQIVLTSHFYKLNLPYRPKILPGSFLSHMSDVHPSAIPIPDGLFVENGAAAGSQLLPQAVYNGSHPVVGQQIKLKIGNGGAGQSGLIGEWANAFIDYCTQEKKMESFSVRNPHCLTLSHLSPC